MTVTNWSILGVLLIGCVGPKFEGDENGISSHGPTTLLGSDAGINVEKDSGKFRPISSEDSMAQKEPGDSGVPDARDRLLGSDSGISDSGRILSDSGTFDSGHDSSRFGLDSGSYDSGSPDTCIVNFYDVPTGYWIYNMSMLCSKCEAIAPPFCIVLRVSDGH